MPTLAELLDPMPGRVAVQVKTSEEITPAGLYIPEGSARTIQESRATQGIVVALGDERDEDPPINFSVGDVVVFGKYSGVELRYQPPGPDDDDQEIPHYKKRPKPAPEKIIIMTYASVLTRIKDASEAEKIKVRH
jgi:co-chaperonin GroES (HSP10)